MNQPPSEPIARKSAVELFRAKTSRHRIHPLEATLLWVVAAQLVFLPWALGGTREWAQWISLAFSVTAFGVALMPRDYDEPSDGHAPFRLYTWPKLVRFPIFWLGLALLAYIVVGALNPAWTFESDGKAWWMCETPHRAWLPAGVQVPFAMWGPWRMLIIYAAAWLTVCATWIGLIRRISFQTLFTVLAANAFLLAGLGIAQRGTGADKIFWFWKPPASYFVSSFTYKNHAGAYFDLLLALCAGLAFWYYECAQRRLDKSSPAGLFAFFGTAVAMIVFFSYSRTATILMFAFLLVTFGFFTWRMFFKAGPDRRSPLLLVVLVIAFVAFVRIGLVSLRIERFVESMEALGGQMGTENVRPIVTRTTLGMAQDRLATGWGSGSFRFIFPIYQQRVPEIASDHGQHLYWEHAHNDYAELLAEFGIVGCAFWLAGFGYAVWRLLKLAAWQNPLAQFVVLGCGVTLVHNIVDFNFFNPAILTTWCVLLFAVIRWVELEELAVAG